VEKVARGEKLRDFVTAEFGAQTGRESFAPSEYADPYLRDTYGVGVSIIHDPTNKDGYTIISSYPRNPE
jgi:hypothetical protein